MPLTQRTAIRAALRIHERLIRRQKQSPSGTLSTHYWEQVCIIQCQLELANKRGWSRAANHLGDNLLNVLSYLAHDAESLITALREQRTDVAVLGAGEVYQELRAVEEEFEDVTCDLRADILAVTTPPIVLEGVPFGSFEIRLDWNQLDESSPYHVVALEPHYPVNRSDITHPHVQDDHLCEGDAARSLRKALLSGRLYDFFQIVNQTLNTYNASSPYLKLSRWSESSASCNDCEADIDLDDAYGCNRCGTTLCESCSVYCEQCNDRTCSSCSRYCAGCDCYFCRGCLTKCPDCSDLFCEGCLDDGICKQCREDRCGSETTGTEETNKTPSAAPVQPDGVGQAAVPA